MKSLSIRFFLSAAALALVASTPLTARADQVLYNFVALRGPASMCQWFDDKINDRGLDSIIHQTDMLYNRTTLKAGAQVANVQTAALQNGTNVAGFTVNGVQLCAGDDAINPSATPAAMPVQPPDVPAQ